MTRAPLPPNEDARLRKLQSYDILDSLDEREYDDIVRLVSEICNTPIANISFVDRDRQWFKAMVGLSRRETPRDVAFCAHTIHSDEMMVVEDASRDPRFADNPLVVEDPGIRFYAGVPLTTPDGYRLGALCAIDNQRRTLTEEQRTALSVLGRHVMNLLELRRTGRQLEELSDLKSRLLAIVAHDMKNPIVALSSLLSLLAEDALDPAELKAVITRLESRVSASMSLIDNILAWSTTMLQQEPTGFAPAADRRVTTRLSVLAGELREILDHELAGKGNALEVDVDAVPPVTTDPNILLFVLRSLLSNANKYTSGGKIRLEAAQQDGATVITVSDTGMGMTERERDNLFNWSSRIRKPGTSGEVGAGLALLLSRDMLARVGGWLAVESTPGVGTRFAVTVPPT